MKTVNHARSERDGIIFYSNIENYLGVRSYIDETGKINSKFIPIQIYDLFENQFNSDDKPEINLVAIIVFNIALISFSLFYLRNIKLKIISLLFVGVSKEFFYILKNSWNYKLGNKKSLARFHGAEHMVINAYQSLQHIPNLEEIKKFSRFSTKCGSMIIFNPIICFLLLSICVIFISETQWFLYFSSLFGVFILTKFGSEKGLFSFLQVFVTSKPTDTELLVAITGLEEFEKMEQLLESKDMNLLFKYLGKSIDYDF